MVREIFLASPRGFCAGVQRAVSLVENTLENHGAPVYVRHEIVHNKHVIEDLKKKGVIFIEDFTEITDKSRPVIISAHGAPLDVYQQAEKLNLHLIDATCPLVEKVHRRIKKLHSQDLEIIVIGKKQHPEITGTIGQIPEGSKVHIIDKVNDAAELNISSEKTLGIFTQTTLSVDDTNNILSVLHQRFANIITPAKADICYATTHRQKAVKELAKKANGIVIIGSKNSSNTRHLQETALQSGAQKTWLIDDVSELELEELDNLHSLGISAGASAPEYLVNELISKLKDYYENLNIHDIIVAEEQVEFKGDSRCPGRKIYSKN